MTGDPADPDRRCDATSDSPAAAPPLGRGRRLWRALADDLLALPHHLLVHLLAGSNLAPRFVRYGLYRLRGLAIDTYDVHPGCTFIGRASNVRIGRGTFVNRDCYFEAVAPISIGRNCAIGMQVMFATSDHPLSDDGRWSLDPAGRPVVVGDDVWIGARATVLPGVTIGDHAVIASGSIVNRDCEPWSVYAGVPARLIRRLAGHPDATSDHRPE